MTEVGGLPTSSSRPKHQMRKVERVGILPDPDKGADALLQSRPFSGEFCHLYSVRTKEGIAGYGSRT